MIYADLQVSCLRQIPLQVLYMQFLSFPHPLDSNSVHCLGSCQVPVKAAGLDKGLKLGLSFSTLLDWDPNYHNDKNRVLKLNGKFIQTNIKIHWVPKFSHLICSQRICKSTVVFTFKKARCHLWMY